MTTRKYESEKDKCLHEFTYSNGLKISVHKYEGEQEKIKLGPRLIRGKPFRVGRLSPLEVKWMMNKLQSVNLI